MSFLRLPKKDALAAKLIDYPLLNSILRILLYERLFRLAVVGIVLMVCGVGLFVVKIWTASPKGFVPVIKLSGLDHLQAWSLRRTALKHAAAGRYDEAYLSWKMALGNAPFDRQMLHECLNHLLQGTERRDLALGALTYGRWLLRISETNKTDLELVARLYDHFGLNDSIIQTLSTQERQLTPDLEVIYLKALFNRSEFSRFGERWDDAQLRGIKFSQPEIALYRAAYDAGGWGPLNVGGSSVKQLEAAKQDPALRILAHRLQLKVSEHLVQPEAYRQSLELLEEWHRDRLEDHIGYWRLLTFVGRKSEALKLMDAHVKPPATGDETVLLAKVHFDLGQPEKSREILQRYAPQFSDSEPVWVSYANLLTDQKRWRDLKEVALLIRHEENPLREALAPYSYYLEGVSEMGDNRRDPASAAFQKIITAKTRNVVWELVVAEKLQFLGFPDIARQLLVKIQKDAPNDGAFWMKLARRAFDLQETEVLIAALSSAHKLRPDDPEIINNYAAALLATRQRPDEALRLTRQLLEKSAGATAAKLNHCEALLQNNQSADAEVLLSQIDPTQLTDAERTSYHFVQFELALARQRHDEAKKASALIDERFLLPSEKQWLLNARRQLEKPVAAKS